MSIFLHKQNRYISHQFQVVPESFFLRHDGILGNDFIQLHKVSIVAPQNRLKIGDYFIPTKNEIIKNLKPDLTKKNNEILPNTFTVPPRSETFVGIKILNPSIEFGIMEDRNLSDLVFLPRAILKNNESGYAITSVLNLSNVPFHVKDLCSELHALPSNSRIHNSSANQNIKETNNTDRFEELLKVIDLTYLNEEEKNSLLPILHEFKETFFLKGDALTHTNTLKHRIETVSDKPINAKNYRYPYKLRDEVRKQISEMLNQGIIAPSTSPWNAPIWIVPKKADKHGNKLWRLVVDYRKLNDVTIGDSYPLPNLVDILDQLGRAKYFSTIDLQSGYYQVLTDEKDAEKTAFSTEQGHFQFRRMGMGLKNAAATFQRLMFTAMSGLVGTRCFVYLDDIVIYAESIEEHTKKLKEVLQQLEIHQLKVNPGKCQFLSKEVTYLGHSISAKGCRPKDERIEAISKYEPGGLKNIKQVKQFLGIIGFYRRFIPNMSEIAKPLVNLLKKDVPFMWSADCQSSFETLKQKLTSRPLLVFPDFSKSYTVTTDASEFAIAGVLQQEIHGNLHPVAYFSRGLNSHEIRYSVIEKEALAIVNTFEHFRPYLYGNRFKIRVQTDHKPLKWLFNVKNPASRLLRWRLRLEEYNYEIHYIPGSMNHLADALSRDSRHSATNNASCPGSLAVLGLPSMYPLSSSDSVQNESNSDGDTETSGVPPDLSELSTVTDRTFDEFVEYSYENIVVNHRYTETSDRIETSRTPILLFLSSDRNLEEMDSKLTSIDDLETKLPSTINAGEVHRLILKRHTVYVAVSKRYYFEFDRLDNLFSLICRVRQMLISNGETSISLSKFGQHFNNLKWNAISSILKYIFFDDPIDIIVCLNKIKIPKPEEIPLILKEFHTDLISGHSGVARTYKRIINYYKWKNMRADIAGFIKTCPSCQRNKKDSHRKKAPMELTTTSSRPFEKLSIDVVGPYPPSDLGNRFVITAQDDLTRFAFLIPTENHEAATVADALVEHIFSKFGIPDTILTDRGTEFLSKLMKRFTTLYGIKHNLCTAYHPESNGALERSHGVLHLYLRHYINNNQTNWDKFINMSMFAYNTSVNRNTGFTPYELLFGHIANVPSLFLRKPKLIYGYEDYVAELKQRLQENFAHARENLEKSKLKEKDHYDLRSAAVNIKAGDFIYLKNEQTRLQMSRKLTPPFTGPYEVIRKTGPVDYIILVNQKETLVHANRLKLAYER